MQLALAQFGERHQCGMRRHRNGALEYWRVAAAQQYRLAAKDWIGQWPGLTIDRG